MNELTDQLRRLGEAAETAVAAVTPDEITERDQIIDLDLARPTRAGRRRPSRRTRVTLTAAAVVVLLAALGSALLMRRSDDQAASLQTASQSVEGSHTTFAVPQSDNGWEALRFCESSGQYDADTGNSFYGAYQFTFESFHQTAERLQLTEYVGVIPVVAPPHVQDGVANAIFLEHGRDPWPVCKRFIEGPMITPVVPQWIAQSGTRGHTLIVFLETDVESDRAVEIGQEIEAIVGSRIADTIEFVDKQAAFDEFREMFDGNDEVLASLTVDVMPASYRMIGEVNQRSQMPQLRDIVGVFEVTTPAEVPTLHPDAPHMKISIPALNLASPVYGAASIENLARGPAVIGGNEFAPAIGGYGSVEGAVFAQINALEVGDEIVVSQLQTTEGYLADIEVARTYVVAEVFTDHVESVPRLGRLETPGVTLVADVPGNPTLRVVVTTRPAPPIDLASYGLETGE